MPSPDAHLETTSVTFEPGLGPVRSPSSEIGIKRSSTALGIFPKAGDYDSEVNAWTGFRLATPNSQLIVGRSKKLTAYF
ncbi:hypothetical protein BN77_p230018 [Rhizobium mesoamericanum STM3625]|uniref:Uncharacterized protein n=1 Tax=Rhizobium mesoamericanum STM3625 TaxID=1211777 RepID=K0Q1J4_9HYPH|nr:hypothetical protein BN77_p230018 [Rhizobium mesoamericanum STM3625]